MINSPGIKAGEQLQLFYSKTWKLMSPSSEDNLWRITSWDLYLSPLLRHKSSYPFLNKILTIISCLWKQRSYRTTTHRLAFFIDPALFLYVNFVEFWLKTSLNIPVIAPTYLPKTWVIITELSLAVINFIMSRFWIIF